MIVTSWAAFTAIAGVISFFSSGIGLFALQMAVGIGLNYAARALAGKPKAPGFSVQGKLQAGGDVPRSFMMGYGATAGSLVYANTWGQVGDSPNAYLVQVIALSDLPVQSLEQIWVNGELCDLEDTPHADYGYPVTQYRKGGKDYLWIKFYDGTQTTADAYLTSKYATDPDRPYTVGRVGTGIAYVICTALVNDKLFSGFPTFKFALNGVKLYDPSKDSTNGGSGTHRWNTPSTWGGDGDHLPAVQLYNIVRGITYGGAWLYGLQNIAATRLPSANWIAQIEKCRDEIAGPDGDEPMYRAGGEVAVNVPIANGIEAFLTACQGKLSEIGGVYKMHCGAPGSADFTFTDDDILSTEEQSFTPFFGLADSVNGMTAKYPEPAEGWNSKVPPPIYRSDLEERDGNRRLLADVSFDVVPYAAQVQRLMKSAIEEGQRARRHTISLPPAYWVCEPGDIAAWTSARNGYESKLFRVDGVIDQPNLDVTIDFTEVDPADYDWDVETDFTPVVTGTLIPVRPAPQPIIDWYVAPATIVDATGVSRRPAIELNWDGDQVNVSGVQFEVRLEATGEVVYRGRTDNLEAGSIIISQNLLPDTNYEARGQYIPTWPRDMLWSDWLPVTTPDVRLSLEDMEAAVRRVVDTEFAAINNRLAEYQELVDRLLSENAAQAIIGDADNRTDLVNRIQSVTGGATATLQEVWTVATNTQGALASFETTVNATLGSHSATLTTYGTAIATLNGQVAAAWGVKLTVDGYVSGVQLINGGSGSSAFIVSADVFKVAWPSMTGGSPVDVFAISNVSGSPKLVFRGDMFADGIIVGRAIAAATITGAKIDADTITVNNLTVNSATKTTYQDYTLPTLSGIKYFPATSTIVSVTVTTKSTTILVRWNAHIKADFTGIAGGSYETRTFQLKIDGSVADTKSFYSNASSGYGSGYSSMLFNGTTEFVITGLTPGSHTFALYYTGANLNAGGDGSIIISDLYR
jgi:hypothetical protein